jgi:putative ABC transport system permease protein
VTALVSFSRGFERSVSEIYRRRDVDLVVVRAGVTERFTSSLNEPLADRLRALPGVAAVSPSLTDMVSLGEGSLMGVPVHGWLADSFSLASLQIVEGRRLTNPDRRAVMLGQGLAQSLKKHAGDMVQIESGDFRVIGVFRGANIWEEATAVVPLHELQALMERVGQVTEFQVVLKPGLNSGADTKTAIGEVAAAIENLRDAHGQRWGLAAIRTGQFISSSTDVRLVHALAWASSLIVLVIGGIGMLNTMTMAVLERTQEIGLLRAVGWRKWRICLLILCESELLSLAGAALGIVCGIALVLAVERMSFALGLVRTEFPPAVIAWGLSLALAMGFAGGLYPALRGAHLQPIEALRYE